MNSYESHNSKQYHVKTIFYLLKIVSGLNICKSIDNDKSSTYIKSLKNKLP